MRNWLLLLWGAIAGAAYGQSIDVVGTTLWSGVRDVDVRGDYAYCAFPNGLLVLNLSDPSSPAAVQQLDLPGEGHEILLAGNYAYFAAREAGVHILNIETPWAPALVRTINTPGDALSLSHYGNTLCVAEGATGMTVIDVSNPSAPVITGSLQLENAVFKIVVSERWAYCAVAETGLLVADIQDPDSIAVVGSYPAADITGLESSLGYVYLLGSVLNSFQIIDAGNPYEPVHIGSMSHVFMDSCYSAAISADFAYVGTTYGLRIVDISDPQLPVLSASYALPDLTFGVAAMGDHVVAATEFTGIHVVNVSTPSLPVHAGTFETPGWVADVTVSGGHAYVVNGLNGLHVFDVHAPQYFSQVAWENGYGASNGITVAGNYAYFVAAQPKLPVVNVSDPGRPVLNGGTETPGVEWRTRVRGDYEFVASRERGVYVLNVSAPSNPQIVGWWDSPGTCWDVAVDGNYAFIADGGVGLDVLDISNPAQPTLVGHVWNNQWGWGPYRVQISNGYAFMVGDINDLLIVDIHDPQNPFIVTNLTDEPGVSQGLFVNGGRAFVLTNFGLRIYDVNNPASPQLTETFETSGRAWEYLKTRNIYVEGEYVYIADGYSFQILHYNPLRAGESNPVTTEDFDLINNFPNPFNPATTINYAVGKEAAVDLAIFDVTGVRVATLVNGRQQPGNYRAVWDAANFPSGMYFATLRAGERVETRKLVLMK